MVIYLPVGNCAQSSTLNASFVNSSVSGTSNSDDIQENSSQYKGMGLENYHTLDTISLSSQSLLLSESSAIPSNLAVKQLNRNSPVFGACNINEGNIFDTGHVEK